MAEKNNYPFIFINHGKPIDTYSFQGEKYFIFMFKENINGSIAGQVEECAPEILSGSFSWTENVLMNYSVSGEDEIIGYYLKYRSIGYDEALTEELSMEIFTDLACDIEKWAVEVNKIAPVDFFIGHQRVKGSGWDKYSDKMLGGIIDKLGEQARSAGPTKKKILNEALQQVLQSKNKQLGNGNRNKVKDLIVITE